MQGFSGYPITRWNGDRLMYLVEKFYYIDKTNKKWVAPVNAELNGATIPQALWNSVGPPYVGPYRRASVIHDYFVGEGSNPGVSFKERRLADKIFFEGCRFDGCSWSFAAVLYLGVSIGSWASKNVTKSAKMDQENVFMQSNEDIHQKFEVLKAKCKQIIEGSEDFEALQNIVESQINDF